MSRIRDYLIKIWPLFPAIFYLVGFQIIVFVYLLTLSLSAVGDNSNFPTFATFSIVCNDRQFINALHNTVVFTILGTPLELMVGLVMALLFYRKFPYRNFIRSIFLIPLAIPALVTAMLLYILFDYPSGHINHLLLGNYPPFPGFISEPIAWRSSHFTAMALSLLGKIWRDMPISMLILLSGINTIDPELLDAAKTMGASLRQRLTRIILPLIIPSISAVVLLRSVEMWKEFIFPFVLAGRHRFLGTLIDYYYNDAGNVNGAAVVAILMLMGIIVTSVIVHVVIDMIKKKLVDL